MNVNWDELAHNEIFALSVAQSGGDKAARLGPYASYDWLNDPKHLFFIMARYKFCAKMLNGYGRIVDFGCGDATGMPLLLQSVHSAVGVDVVPEVIAYNQKHNQYADRVAYRLHNIVEAPLAEQFDAAVSLDVLEHIEPKDEESFLANISKSLKEYAPCIVGTPNVTASAWAGKSSRHEHVNLKDHESLRNSLEKHFHNVFLFSMNDEVLHTGFYAMSHYIIALAVHPKCGGGGWAVIIWVWEIQ